MNALFAAIDRMDPDGFASFLTEGGTFRMGSFPAVQGRKATADSVASFWTTVESSRHSDVRSYEAGPNDRFVSGTVTYGLKNGQKVSVPFLNHLRLEDGLVAEYLIYIDPTPVAAAHAYVA